MIEVRRGSWDEGKFGFKADNIKKAWIDDEDPKSMMNGSQRMQDEGRRSAAVSPHLSCAANSGKSDCPCRMGNRKC